MTMACIIEITHYTTTRSHLPNPRFPSPNTLIKTIESPHLFSYTDGILEPINDSNGAERGRLQRHKCAGIFISEGPPLPGGADERIFFTIHGHPKEGTIDDIWIPLGFEEVGTNCILGHIGASNKLPCNPHMVPTTPSWLKLFTGTRHISPHTAGTSRVLLGPPEILWGLIALNVGDDIGNLGAYIIPGDHGLSLNWQTENVPDRTPARVLAVKVYYNSETPQEELDMHILLV